MEAYQRLEHEYAEFCNNPNTVACSSGTAALHLALETLQVTENWGGPPGPRVVVPDFAMIACARAVTLAGMVPEFVDVNELGLIEYPSGSPNRSECVMVVHTYGRQSSYVDASRIDDKIVIVEDLAEAHGIKVRPSSIACWSFYKNKVIAGEEGGMVAFKTAEQASLAKKLRNMGFEGGQSSWHIPRGMNYRLSNCHAELILHSLHNYDTNLAKRKQVEEYYNEYCPEEWLLPNRDIPWVYDLNLPIGIDVDTVVAAINKSGVEARCGFKPLSQQREYSRLECERCSEPGEAMLDGVPYSKNPVADRLSKTRMYLSIKPWMTDSFIERIMLSLWDIVEIVKTPA